MYTFWVFLSQLIWIHKTRMSSISMCFLSPKKLKITCLTHNFHFLRLYMCIHPQIIFFPSVALWSLKGILIGHCHIIINRFPRAGALGTILSPESGPGIPEGSNGPEWAQMGPGPNGSWAGTRAQRESRPPEGRPEDSRVHIYIYIYPKP